MAINILVNIGRKKLSETIPGSFLWCLMSSTSPQNHFLFCGADHQLTLENKLNSLISFINSKRNNHQQLFNIIYFNSDYDEVLDDPNAFTSVTGVLFKHSKKLKEEAEKFNIQFNHLLIFFEPWFNESDIANVRDKFQAQIGDLRSHNESIKPCKFYIRSFGHAFINPQRWDFNAMSLPGIHLVFEVVNQGADWFKGENIEEYIHIQIPIFHKENYLSMLHYQVSKLKAINKHLTNNEINKKYDLFDEETCFWSGEETQEHDSPGPEEQLKGIFDSMLLFKNISNFYVQWDILRNSCIDFFKQQIDTCSTRKLIYSEESLDEKRREHTLEPDVRNTARDILKQKIAELKNRINHDISQSVRFDANLKQHYLQEVNERINNDRRTIHEYFRKLPSRDSQRWVFFLALVTVLIPFTISLIFHYSDFRDMLSLSIPALLTFLGYLSFTIIKRRHEKKFMGLIHGLKSFCSLKSSDIQRKWSEQMNNAVKILNQNSVYKHNIKLLENTERERHREESAIKEIKNKTNVMIKLLKNVLDSETMEHKPADTDQPYTPNGDEIDQMIKEDACALLSPINKDNIRKLFELFELNQSHN